MTKRRIASTPRRYWTAEDDRVMRERFPHEPTPDVARALNRTVAATYARAGKLRLLKTAVYLATPAACRLRRGDNVGKPFRFQPGQAPKNKGLRRPGWAPGRMSESQFKKG